MIIDEHLKKTYSSKLSFSACFSVVCFHCTIGILSFFQPRDNEAGGKFGRGIITRRYRVNQAIEVNVITIVIILIIIIIIIMIITIIIIIIIEISSPFSLLLLTLFLLICIHQSYLLVVKI